MKTLNQILRTTLLLLILFCSATTVLAYSFMVDGIYYNINGNNATVTYTSMHYSGSIAVYDSNYSGDVVIPETVTYNGSTYTVTRIGDRAFIGCSELTSVTIPETVTTIDTNAFYNCSGLTSITLPESISVINNQAFFGCSSLRGVICHSSIPPTVNGDYVFYNYNLNQVTLYVPLAALEEYKTAPVWKRFYTIGYGQNTFSVVDYTTLYGDTIAIPVTMENVEEITAFQTDIYLPTGFELLKEGEDYMVDLSDRKGRDHVIMASDAPDGAVRVLSYSPTLKTFSGNDGELFYFTIRVPNDGDGNVIYPIWLRKTLLTTIDEEEVGALETLSNIDVYFYVLGDVDHSGDITVTDVVETARYILNQNPDPFIFDAADITGDGKITITDVVKIAHMVLDADYDEPEIRLTANGNNSERMGGEMNGNIVGITLENNQEYTAFQLDLTLPEGMAASEFALTNRANVLDLVVKDKGNGRIRLMGYTPSLKTIKGNEGKLLTFQVTGENDIVVDHIDLVTPEGETVHPNGFTIQKSPATAVKELAASKAVDHVDYYNMAGQRIDRPMNGVTLVITTYTDDTRTTTKIIQ